MHLTSDRGVPRAVAPESVARGRRSQGRRRGVRRGVPGRPCQRPALREGGFVPGAGMSLRVTGSGFFRADPRCPCAPAAPHRLSDRALSETKHRAQSAVQTKLVPDQLKKRERTGSDLVPGPPPSSADEARQVPLDKPIPAPAPPRTPSPSPPVRVPPCLTRCHRPERGLPWCRGFWICGKEEGGGIWRGSRWIWRG